MDATAIINLLTLLSLIGFGTIAKWYIWPKFKSGDVYGAVEPLLVFSFFRYLGLLFILPQAGIPAGFATTAAMGDLSVGILAFIGAIFVHKRSGIGITLAWLYAILGSVDFLIAGGLANMNGVADHAEFIWLVFTVLGPAWMITLALLFVSLIKLPKKV